jgi:hypothetical protein
MPERTLTPWLHWRRGKAPVQIVVLEMRKSAFVRVRRVMREDRRRTLEKVERCILRRCGFEEDGGLKLEMRKFELSDMIDVIASRESSQYLRSAGNAVIPIHSPALREMSVCLSAPREAQPCSTAVEVV